TLLVRNACFVARSLIVPGNSEGGRRELLAAEVRESEASVRSKHFGEMALAEKVKRRTSPPPRGVGNSQIRKLRCPSLGVRRWGQQSGDPQQIVGQHGSADQ